MKTNYLLIKNFLPMKTLLSIAAIYVFVALTLLTHKMLTHVELVIYAMAHLIGNASWGADCADGSDEILEYCCAAENGFSAYLM